MQPASQFRQAQLSRLNTDFRHLQKPSISVQMGTGIAKILFVGPSETSGYMSGAASNYIIERNSYVFASIARDTYRLPVSVQSCIGATIGTYGDTRCTLGADWISSNAILTAAGWFYKASFGGTHPLSCAWTQPVDSCTVYYAKAPGTGVFKYDLMAALATNVNTAGPSGSGPRPFQCRLATIPST